MSKSHKKQKERERAREAELVAGEPAAEAEAPSAQAQPAAAQPKAAAAQPQPAAKPRAAAAEPRAAAAKPKPAAAQPRPPASPKAAGATGVDEELFERVAEAVMLVGEPREEGERQSWLYNGDTLSIKYVEEDDTQPRRLMVAAFRQGVVYQVEGDRQVVHQPGDWPDRLPGADESRAHEGRNARQSK